ncbi:MAG: LamG domain-containing protein, partial [Verrucomicrobiota bacterium]|nr:LamG domain-containing protein [Verrucomicrobiota bacterium]
TSDKFVDSVGGLEAVPSSRLGAAWIEGSDYCPVGTNAFPAAYGVYDPVGGTNVPAVTALYFHKESLDGNAGALRVADPAPLRLTTFTVECFVRMQPGVDPTEWHVIAVMPRQLKNGSTTIKNCDSWGLRVIAKDRLHVRFTKSDYTLNGDVISGQSKQEIGIAAPTIYDGNWHHVAFTVEDKVVHTYFDYARAGGGTLSNNVSYGAGEDLFIGNTPQTPGPFAGSIAHFRISDQALETSDFLHFTRIEKTADEADDVLFRASFEPVAGLSATRAIFNDMATGSALLHCAPKWSDTTLPVLWSEAPFSQTYASVIAPIGRENTTSLSNAAPNDANAKHYLGWRPEKDVFTNTSFTVECFYKTTLDGQWIPLVRRLGGSNVQFNLGFGTTVGCLSATVYDYYSSTGEDFAKAINDPEPTNDNTWHHAALVVNAERKKVSLYRDRKLIGTQNYNGKLVPTTSSVTIAGASNADRPYKGLVDEVRITQRALGPEEFLSVSHVDTSARTVAWLGFEDGFAARAADSALKSPVAAAATDEGSAPVLVATDRPGRITDMAEKSLRETNTKAALFDRSVIKFGADPYLALLDSFTVEFYVKCGPNDPFAGIIRCNAESDGGTPAWALAFADGETSSKVLLVRAAVCSPTEVDKFCINDDTGIVIGDGRWHHIAMTVEQTADGTTMRIYKDHAQTPAWSKQTTGRLYYGSAQGEVWLGASSSTTAFFKGRLDEVRISRGVLPPEEFLSYGKCGLVLQVR